MQLILHVAVIAISIMYVRSVLHRSVHSHVLLHLVEVVNQEVYCEIESDRDPLTGRVTRPGTNADGFSLFGGRSLPL